MSPEAGHFVAKAQKMLEDADDMLAIALWDAAGRTAYLAGFHAAQAFVFERLGRVLKTHRGVRSEFLRLTMDDARFDPLVRNFLAQTYNLKSIADYEVGPGAEVSPELAESAVHRAKHFVAFIRELLLG